jgi:predicted PurR-regulated permease PerM
MSEQTGATLAVNRLLFAALVLTALYLGRDVFIPLALAVLLSVALMPVTDAMKRIGLPRIPAVIVVLLLTMATIGGLLLLLAGQVVSLAASLPDYEATLMTKLQGLAAGPGVFDRMLAMVKRLEGAVSAPDAAPMPALVMAAPAPASPMSGMLALAGSILAPVATVAIALLLMAFLMISREDVRDRFLRLAGTRDLHRTTRALADATDRVGRYLLMQVVVNGSFGLGMGLGLWLIGLPNAPLWGLLGFVLRFIPFLGAPLSVLFPLLIAFATTDGWGTVLLVVALFLVVDVAASYVMEPLLYGRSTGISPLAMVLSAALWAVLWGPVGLIIAPPITACLVIIGRHVPGLEFLEVLLSDRAALPAPMRFYQRLLADDPAGAEEIAEAEMRDNGARTMLESLVLPTLESVRDDRRAGVLEAPAAQRIATAIATMVADLTEEETVLTADDGGPVLDVAVLPVAGAIDRAAAEAMAALLRAEGHAARLTPPGGDAADAAVAVMLDQAGSARVRRAIAAAQALAPTSVFVALAGTPPAGPLPLATVTDADSLLAAVARSSRRAPPVVAATQRSAEASDAAEAPMPRIVAAPA